MKDSFCVFMIFLISNIRFFSKIEYIKRGEMIVFFLLVVFNCVLKFLFILRKENKLNVYIFISGKKIILRKFEF